tara:strand:+ start:238 stop:1701 length:1464 start_codon:yes stop_codon:yes gene_type:complete
MGRFEKVLLEKNGVDRRKTGYYSTPNFIASYLTKSLLSLNPDGKLVLDPAVGQEELLETFFLSGKEIESFDIVDHGEKRFSNFFQKDFIEFYIDKKLSVFFESEIHTDHDYWIANPPYNCHEIDYIRDNKVRLKKIFNGVGVHNMYSMFLAAMIDLAKEGAVLGVIISDSFLTATMHSGLRQKILDECSIHQLILCPTDLFWDQKADVRTSILVLQKGKSYQGKVRVSNRPINSEHLEKILSENNLDEVGINEIVLGKSKNANQFIVDVDHDIINLFKYPRVGELYECVTGISTGNDSKYLSSEPRPGFEVPFYKNPGSRKFITSPDAYLINDYLEEDKKVKDFMVRNKKLIGSSGITCSSMGLPFSACYLPPNSTFGVNPNIFLPESDLNWMLAYLNSSLVTYLVRGVLIRSNMVTSGYISQLPVPQIPDEIKLTLGNLSKDVLDQKLEVNSAIEKIDEVLFKYLNINSSVVEKIKQFANNLSRSV